MTFGRMITAVALAGATLGIGTAANAQYYGHDYHHGRYEHGRYEHGRYDHDRYHHGRYDYRRYDRWHHGYHRHCWTEWSYHHRVTRCR